ncbi:hypothetical protein [Nonomuraea gerenzanensis]|uniref:Secreted protein n=1 Tax=Nonomuraea gerenzanensis TaxID=93944 RepID=A0A1M4EHE2_9ACTN|nr:hypothetical protein [Nonomuraea gerenzanensis]UBU09664.1 hypothetical protein LCN96_35580 [Nonomuraea gerenzanensis]SBO98098.1 secreted protein [Nonomuraea gerenzanensis]
MKGDYVPVTIKQEVLPGEGRSGDAGESSGRSPDPTGRDADSTSWSHACRWAAGRTWPWSTTRAALSCTSKYGQGFHGWIGDVRIVARALRPKAFLTPYA